MDKTKKPLPAVQEFLDASGEAAYTRTEVERAKLEKEARDAIWKQYVAAVSKGNLPDAIEMARYVRSAMDLRSPEQIASADISAVREYPASIKSLEAACEKSRQVRAAAELIAKVTKQSIETARAARAAKQRIRSAASDLSRLAAFGLPVGADVDRILKADERGIDAIEKQIGEDWGVVALSDSAAIPVRRSKKSKK